MSRKSLKLIAVVMALLGLIAVDNTNYGGADSLAQDIAALDELAPRGTQDAIPVDSLRTVLDAGIRRGTDDMALDIHRTNQLKEAHHEPIPTRTAANPR